MRNINTYSLSRLAVAVCSLSIATPALADTAVAAADAGTNAPAASGPQAQASQKPDTQIQEIVVTAQKRVQRGNDVGVTMNVMSGNELAAAGIHQVVDLAALASNVQIKNVLGNSIPNITIRGIGLNDYASNNNPAAGVYVDNVYLVSPAMLQFGMFDVDRVEMLKGPQGDLYGRNTTAGAVNIISRQPSATTSVDVQTGYGEYGNWHFDGAVGGALTSTLNARFALQTVQQTSGWQTNYVTGQKVGKINRTAGRLQLDWRPSDSVKVHLSGHMGYDRSDEALYKAQNTLTNEWQPYANQPYTAGGSNNPHVDLNSVGGSGTIDWAINPNLSLTSISAYEHFTRADVADQDGTSLQQLDSTFQNQIDQFSQETRLNYSAKDLNLIGGVFYSVDTVSDRDSYAAKDLLPLLGLAGLDTIGNTYHQHTETYAGFVHGEWTFAPKLTLVGGLRWTHEHKIFDNATTFLGVGGVNTDVFAPQTSYFSTSKVSGKIGLNYKAADHTLVYASISQGFKGGGFQGQLTFDPTAYKPFNDENLTAYEIGIKSRVVSNLQVNAAVFDYEYHDAQFYGPLYNSPVGVLFGIANVGNARVKGLEGDALWRPVSGLDLRAGIGMIDTKITKSIVAGVATGSELPDAPKLTLNGTLKYKWRLSNKLGADITLNGNYQSSIAFDVVRNPVQAQYGGYFLGNAEAGLNIGVRWRASLWAKNVFNHVYETQALYTSVGWTYQYGAPRTYGINLSYKM